jgi:hypothetical protein
VTGGGPKLARVLSCEDWSISTAQRLHRLARSRLGRLARPLRRSGRARHGRGTGLVLDRYLQVADLGSSTRLTHGGNMRRVILPACRLPAAVEQWDAVAKPDEQRELELCLPLGQLPALCG